MWRHVNSCYRAVACLYQEGGLTGITFCHQTGGPKTGWDYTQDFMVCEVFYYMAELVQGEKENSDWFPEWSEFCYTDR